MCHGGGYVQDCFFAPWSITVFISLNISTCTYIMWPSHGGVFQLALPWKKERKEKMLQRTTAMVSQGSSARPPTVRVWLDRSRPTDGLVHILHSTVELKWWPIWLIKAVSSFIVMRLSFSQMLGGRLLAAEHQPAFPAADCFLTSYITGCFSICTADFEC